MVAMTFPFHHSRVLSTFPLNKKLRWRLCSHSSVHYARAFFAARQRPILMLFKGVTCGPFRKINGVSCWVINAWVNCLNWNQPIDNMKRLITPLVNYVDMDKFAPVSKSIASERLIERLRNFKYMDWKAIDPTKVEYLMTPAIIGNPGAHYVCFVVNLKGKKFELLNSLSGPGDKLNHKNGEPTMYKKMFDVWLYEVEAFVTEMYKQRKMKMPFQFASFEWDTPMVPNQFDSNSCGVFCMKFLAEWGGKMESFKGWSKMKRHGPNGKQTTIMDLRIDICSTILSNSSNSRKDEVEKEASSYYEEMLQKLGSSSAGNH